MLTAGEIIRLIRFERAAGPRDEYRGPYRPNSSSQNTTPNGPPFLEIYDDPETGELLTRRRKPNDTYTK